jgi:hypothetical protein
VVFARLASERTQGFSRASPATAGHALRVDVQQRRRGRIAEPPENDTPQRRANALEGVEAAPMSAETLRSCASRRSRRPCRDSRSASPGSLHRQAACEQQELSMTAHPVLRAANDDQHAAAWRSAGWTGVTGRCSAPPDRAAPSVRAALPGRHRPRDDARQEFAGAGEDSRASSTNFMRQEPFGQGEQAGLKQRRTLADLARLPERRAVHRHCPGPADRQPAIASGAPAAAGDSWASGRLEISIHSTRPERCGSSSSDFSSPSARAGERR